jgi:NADPH2:quinone reductase
MRAAWYEKQGPAREVLMVGEMPEPHPSAGEVRIRIAASGINPGDIKKRQDSFGVGMPFPRIIPHSDGAGRVDQVGEGVPSDWAGRPVWCYGAQSYRPFGTAAEFTVVPLDHVAPLPESVTPDQGACLGIPGITAHRAVHVGGDVAGRTVLVQGAGGAVGMCAAALARRAGARVIGTVRSSAEEPAARTAGAHEVVLNDQALVAGVKALAPDGVDHIVEVAFGYTAADIVGIRQGTSNPKMPLPADVRQYPDAIAQALSQLRLVGVMAPMLFCWEPRPIPHSLKPAIRVIRCWSTSSAWSTIKSFGRLL